ncbi:hypothetical protein DER29_2002 [Micromonospora sp. M71_S20]|uniref:hypothetical protein n=1 Tax=Micromonospora sp. M71_S20 TaxID=592872 RepID=UPI000EB2A042|nr:hypothetical protein [Micromonospora sp. M71_S20]RLK24105.1 hypothetical protein DER29_2002 [Micromonospora sp. M71_S20]
MSHISFLGIPVEGDITPARRVTQRPLEELRPLLRALLDDDVVTEFGWRQYSPYFNDGDTCDFSVEGFWMRTTGDGPRVDPKDLRVGKYAEPHPSLGGSRWVSGRRGPYQGRDEARHQRAYALAVALEEGYFDNVLLDAFGDHAEVTVRREGIQVRYYVHE